MLNKKIDGSMNDMTVFTVPNNKPWILTEEEAEEFLKDMPTRKISKEERAEIRQKVEKLFRKPEKNKDE